jgi:hypothetical protein
MIESVLMRKEQVVPLSLPDLTGVAERVLNQALAFCASRMGLNSTQAAASEVRQGNVTARVHCCSGIARQVAEALGSSEQNVMAIYTPDQDLDLQTMCSDRETQPKSMVHLFVWMRRKTAAFDSLVTAWDRALVQVCKDTIGVQGQRSLLDVQVMDDAYLEQHFGAGRSKGMVTRLAVYWLRTMNQAVDVVYAREGG